MLFKWTEIWTIYVTTTRKQKCSRCYPWAFLFSGDLGSPEPPSRQKVSRISFCIVLKGEAHNTPSLMSTKFFNNIETTLMDKFHGIATAMANFDIFHAVVGYFRSSGYIKLRLWLSSTQIIKIPVSIDIEKYPVRYMPLAIGCSLGVTNRCLYSHIKQTFYT